MEAKSPFQIIGTKVNEFKFKTFLDRGETKPPNIKVNYELIFFDENQFKSTLLLEIKVNLNTISNKKLMELTLKIEGEFEADKALISEEQFIKMSEQNGLMTMLHLSRGTLQGITSLCGVTPGFILPMFNVMELIREHNKKSE